MSDTAPAIVHCSTCEDTGEVAAAFALPGIGALLTPKPCPEPVHHPAYALGDVVRVHGERELSVIVQPTDGRPTCDPEKLPPLSVCCTPVALVVPYVEPRWIQQSELQHADPSE